MAADLPFARDPALSSRDHTFSPRELAAAIGVSESSMKRWIDAGELVAARTAGGHRRVTRREAVRFIRERKLPLADPTALRLPELAGVPELTAPGPMTVERIVEAVREGASSRVRALVVAEYVRGTPLPELCDGLLRDVLHRAGTLWKEDASGIGVEHEATDTFIQALGQLRSLGPSARPGAPVAVGGALAGDPYLIPSLMAAAVLEDLGFDVTNLGPETPTGVLAGRALERGAALVWLSVSTNTTEQTLRGAASVITKQLAGSGAKVVMGGRGAEGLEIPGVTVLPSMQALAAFARPLLPTGSFEE